MGSVRERAVPTLAAVGLSGPALWSVARLGSVCVEVFERLAPVPVRLSSLQIDWWRAPSRQ